MSKHDEDILKLQSNIDKTNLQLQNQLYKDIQAVNKPRKIIKRIKHPENDKTLQQQINDDKYIELNDKLASTIRDELKGKIMDATSYPLTLGDNVNDSYKQLKKNMNNIMTNPGNIELIINSFSVEEIKKLNNNWESIQKKYISKYGFNNPNLTIKEIKEYLLSEMGQSNKSIDDKSIEEVKKKMMEESQKVNNNIKEINDNILLFRNTIDGLHKNKNISLVNYQQKIQEVQDLEKNLNVLVNKNANLRNDLQKLNEELQTTQKEALRDIKGIQNQSKQLEQTNKDLYDFAINERAQKILLQNKLNIIQEEYNDVLNKNNEIKDQSDSLKDEIITDKDKKKNQQNENEEAINENDLMEQQIEQKNENEKDLIEQKMEQKDENDLIEQKMEQKDENDLMEQLNDLLIEFDNVINKYKHINKEEYSLLILKKLRELDIAQSANETGKEYVKIKKNDDYNEIKKRAQELLDDNKSTEEQFNKLLSDFDNVINKYKQIKEEEQEASTEATENPQMEEINSKYGKIYPKFINDKYGFNGKIDGKDRSINNIKADITQGVMDNYQLFNIINNNNNKFIKEYPYYFHYFRYILCSFMYLLKQLRNGPDENNDKILIEITNLFLKTEKYIGYVIPIEKKKKDPNDKWTVVFYDINKKQICESNDGINISKSQNLNKNVESNYNTIMNTFINEDIMTLDFNNKGTVKITNVLYPVYIPGYNSYNNTTGTSSKNLDNHMFGCGINKKDNFINLGENLMINKKKLINDNVLSLVDGNKRKIALYKNTKISDNLVDIILKILDNSKIKNTDLNNLNENERLLYTSLLRRAALHKKYDIDVNDTIEKIKYKYKLLEGEINSGNNNPQLVNDMRDILRKMVNFKLISQNTANNYFKQVKSINK
jgi:hypothetical protein